MGTIRVFSIWWFPFIFFMKWQCWCEVLCLINYNHEKSFLPFLWWKDLTIPLIQLEVEKAGKKHKKEMSVLKLQERITTWSLKKMTLSSMDAGCPSELTVYLLSSRKQQITFMKRLANSSGKHVQIYLCLALTEPTALGLKYKSYKNKKKCCSIIVRFISFRHRKMFYKNRKRLKDVRIKLDLTKRRYGILKDAIDLAREHLDLDFAFGDVNYFNRWYI